MTLAVLPRIVPPAKLTDYLLDPDHPAGGPKAAFFRRFGFSIDRPDVMIAALIAHPDRNPVEATHLDQWGMRYTVRCRIETPDRRDPCILTVWILPPGHGEARLVTAYPAEGS